MKVINPGIEIIDAPEYGAMLKKIERIGRVCYKSEDKIKEDSAEGFIRGIIKRGHESVIEHASITVLVTCDRGVSHEIVRHRVASYSQESTRYCNYTDGKVNGQISYIDPFDAFGWDVNNEEDKEKINLWCKAVDAMEWAYRKLIKAGATPQEARTILPHSLKTEIAITMNLREWRHFIRLRDSKAAHPQMQEVAHMIAVEFLERYPVFFEDLEALA